MGVHWSKVWRHLVFIPLFRDVIDPAKIQNLLQKCREYRWLYELLFIGFLGFPC